MGKELKGEEEQKRVTAAERGIFGQFWQGTGNGDHLEKGEPGKRLPRFGDNGEASESVRKATGESAIA